MNLEIGDKESLFLLRKPWILLIIIGIAGFLIRLNFLPYDLPFHGDAVGYFWYANDLAVSGQFPSKILDGNTGIFPNNGWSTFLSVFFWFQGSDNYLDFINLQRIVAIVISSVTIIPIYFLGKKFFDYKISLITASLFIFSPRLIENSMLGTTESSFLLLLISSLVLFLSDKYRNVVLAFLLAGICVLIRYEGLLVIIPFSIMYFIRFRRRKYFVRKYLLLLTVFILIILPMAYIRIETTGQDGIITHISSGPKYYQVMSENNVNENVYMNYFSKGVFFMTKYLSIMTIPMFALFLPLGIIGFLKKWNNEKLTILFFSVIFLIPAFYAYSRGFEEMKYLFILYPLLTIVSTYSFSKILAKIKRRDLFILLTIIGIIFFSLIFSHVMIPGFEHEKEMYEITKEIAPLVSSVNREYSGLNYLVWIKSEIFEKFPSLSTDIQVDSERIKVVRIGEGTENNFDNLSDYLEFGRIHGMNELIIEQDSSEFLLEVFRNEQQYPYLIKIFDSSSSGYSYVVKVFKIDYNTFEK